jgi:hypothetical protein
MRNVNGGEAQLSWMSSVFTAGGIAGRVLGLQVILTAGIHAAYVRIEESLKSVLCLCEVVEKRREEKKRGQGVQWENLNPKFWPIPPPKQTKTLLRPRHLDFSAVFVLVDR